MQDFIYKTLAVLVVIIALIPVAVFFMVRFSDATITDGEKIIFGYDDEKGQFQINEYPSFELNGIDGPYLINDTIYSVDSTNQVSKLPLQDRRNVNVLVNNESFDRFTVPLKKQYTSPDSEYNLPEKLIAISDIEGNFNGFSSFLQANAVIDSSFNWIFGNGHLVLVGDFVDRGNNVLPVLWLIYKLEQEAQLAGGAVHFILGNHEIMNIHGNFKYAKHKYHSIAQIIGKKEDNRSNNKTLFSANAELGKWMRSKNIIEKIGDYIFVHGGLSPEILPYDISIPEMNVLLRENIDKNLYHEPEDNEKANFVMGIKSPYWYRGFVTNYKHYPKISQAELDTVLQVYEAQKIVIGHCVVNDVSVKFNDKLVRIDVKHGTGKNSGNTKGILVENEQLFKIDDLGNKTEL